MSVRLFMKDTRRNKGVVSAENYVVDIRLLRSIGRISRLCWTELCGFVNINQVSLQHFAVITSIDQNQQRTRKKMKSISFMYIKEENQIGHSKVL